MGKFEISASISVSSMVKFIEDHRGVFAQKFRVRQKNLPMRADFIVYPYAHIIQYVANESPVWAFMIGNICMGRCYIFKKKKG